MSTIAGLAAGLILYIVVINVFHREKCRENVSGLLQYGSALMGFVLVVMIKILGGNGSMGMEQEDSATIVDDYDIFENTTTTTELPPPLVG